MASPAVNKAADFWAGLLYRDTSNSLVNADIRIREDLKALMKSYHRKSSWAFMVYNAREHAINAIAADRVAGILKEIKRGKR